MFTVAEPQDVVPPKAEPATLCHVDLDVVYSRSKFIHEPQYMVGR